jgi:D-aspartate ligase
MIPPIHCFHFPVLFGLTSSATALRMTFWQAAFRRYVARAEVSGPTSLQGHQGAPPVLMMRPAYCGTLAAVRSFGRASISVTVAGPDLYSLAGSSRYATRHLRSPPVTDGEGLLTWLEHFGRREPRHVLLPTCDDTAWLFAKYRDRLSKFFYLSSPPLETIHGLLHKGQLAQHARAVGLGTPRAWFPQSEHDLTSAMSEAHFPALLKATTQALFAARSKGAIVARPEDLPEAYRELSALDHESVIVEHDPSSSRPFVQEFFPDASERIYNISGYIRDGKLWGARAGRKLLQKPRRLGIGLCFEEAELDGALADGLLRLAQRVRFNGVFEAEFVREPGRDVLIDFNPRFYNQMAFDIARGLPLPLLAYDDALEGQTTFGDVAAVNQPAHSTGKIFVHGSEFKLMIAAQRLTGALTGEQARSWLRWYHEGDGRRVDAIDDSDDAWPSRFDKLEIARHHVRHPRAFIRSTLLNR